MAQTIQIPNFKEANIVERSTFAADAAIGVNTLTLNYTDNFSVSDYLYLGRLGTESGEVKIVQSITDADTLVLTAITTKYHSRFDDVASLYGNQAKIYRAANVDGTAPADGSFSYLATVTLDYDQKVTNYTDSSGSSSYWYKFTYFNAANSNETNIANATAARGGNIGNYTSIEAIRGQAGLQSNHNITDEFIDLRRQAAQKLINGRLAGQYTIPFPSPVDPLVEQMTRLLTAGWLLTTNYGPSVTLNTNEGKSMIEEVMNDQGTGLLDRLDKGTLSITGADGSSLIVEGGGNFSGWPNADTATTDVDHSGDTGPAIRIGMGF